ncbi:major capsid protein [Roseateles sp. LKC17W]|uniref:Major capsid protein n=1 Tax=Pelomonas margarita TaxID=3299031 RepID=A0ABW7FIG4_9BURK
MLQFTKEQWEQVKAARARFNQRAVAMAANEAILEGNSLSIPVDAWRRIDSRAQMLARSRLAVFNRLAQASTLPVSIADLVNFYPQISDSNEVQVSMDGRNAAKADAAAVSYVGTPVPVMTTSVRMGWRQMEVLRKGGSMLDTATIANGQRKMAERLEDMAINGLSSVNVNGATIHGLRNLPARNTFAHGFTLASATGAQWLTAFKQAITAALGDNNFGRLTVFVNIGDYTYADTTDYSAAYSGTILQRLRAIAQIAEIIPASSVPANEILGISDLDAGEWGGILSAMPLTTRPKTRQEPEDDYVFGVIAAAAPQFRSDANGQSQFVHGTNA